MRRHLGVIRLANSPLQRDDLLGPRSPGNHCVEPRPAMDRCQARSATALGGQALRVRASRGVREELERGRVTLEVWHVASRDRADDVPRDGRGELEVLRAHCLDGLGLGLTEEVKTNSVEDSGEWTKRHTSWSQASFASSAKRKHFVEVCLQ